MKCVASCPTSADTPAPTCAAPCLPPIYHQLGYLGQAQKSGVTQDIPAYFMNSVHARKLQGLYVRGLSNIHCLNANIRRNTQHSGLSKISIITDVTWH
jgi:hypothetical protein